MADTTKIYENIFIKKNAAGDREYIKVPYAILADPPTIPDVSGFALTSDIHDGILTIQQNGTNVVTFGANQSTNATANITTITDVKMNSTSKVTNGVADLGTVLTDESKFATSAQGTKADNAMPKAGGAFTGAVTVQAPTAEMNPATKQYVDTAINAVKQFEYQVVTELPTAAQATMGKIYLVAHSHNPSDGKPDSYDEFITVRSGSTYKWERIGNTDIDLSGYVPTTRKINKKALSSDITLYPTDVGVTEAAFPGLNKTGTITGINMNGASKGTSGVVDLGTVLTDASKFATSAQGTKADNAMPKKGGTFTGEVKFGSTENFQGYYIKRMIGSLGAGTAYNNLDSSYKDGTWHRMWRLRFPNGSSFWGKIKITLYGGYSSFNASGVMSKSVTCNFNTSNIYNNVGCYDGLGVNVEQDFRISEAIWNATVSAWEVLIWQKNLNGNNSPTIMLECWTANNTNYINAFNGITAQTVELTQSTSYSAQKASSTGGTKTVEWATLPVYENPLGEEIATVAMLEDKQDKITSSNKLSSSLVDGLGAAAAKAVDTAITANSTSTNLPTSKAVEDRINAHSGIDKVGTVTGVKMNETTKNPSSGVVDLGTVLTDESKFATSAQGTKADNAMPKSGGAFTGNVSLPKELIFTDNTNPFIKMTTGGTDFYFQSTSGQFGLGPTWNKATHWDSNGNVTFPTTPKVGSSSLALKSEIPTNYVPNTRKVNNKALSSDITLGASDVGALPTAGGTVTGNLTVGGNLTINGTTTTVDSTTLQVKDKLIEVAHGNTAALTTPAGLVAPKYDGTNSGALVFDSTGTAYVGDVTLKDGNIDVANSGLQPLATRTGLVGGNLVQYDSSALTLKDSGKKISDLALKTDIPNSAKHGSTLLATNTDLNTLYGSDKMGWYHCGGSNSCANKPSGVDAFGLEVGRSAEGYYFQVLTDGNANPSRRYVRTYGSSWAAWQKLAITSDIPTKTSEITNDSGFITSDGSVKSVIDYNNANKNIKIGYQGAGISGDSIKYIAGYTDGDSESEARIKDIDKASMKNWLGYATVATSGSYDDLINKPDIVQTTGTSTSSVMSQNATTNAISGKLDKTTYEWNKEFRASRNGAISLGRYNVYDTQLTFDISSTTDASISGKLVIATQNGIIRQAKVFGDATDILVSKIVIYQSAIVNNRSWVEVFCNFDGWSKNKVHIYGVALDSATVTNQMSSVTFTNGVPSPITSGDSKWSGTIDNDLSKKQDKLTAGSNISISGNTISATVPTKTSELTNNSGFLTSHQVIYDLTFRDALGNDYATFTANESGNTVVPIDVETINETTQGYSLAIGGVTQGAQANGEYCVVLGSNAKARYDNTVKIGYGMTPNNQSVTQINTGSYTSAGRALYLGAGKTGFTYMNAAGSSWASASDIRDKTDIKEIDHALDFIKKLKPITYVMNDRERYLIRDENDNPILDSNGKQQYDIEAHKRGDKKKHRRFAGLSAQDTYQAMLDCYNNDTNYAQIVDNNKFDHPDDEYLEQYSMSYERLVPFLIKAIQEQQEQIEELKSKLGE